MQGALPSSSSAISGAQLVLPRDSGSMALSLGEGSSSKEWHVQVETHPLSPLVEFLMLGTQTTNPGLFSKRGALKSKPDYLQRSRLGLVQHIQNLWNVKTKRKQKRIKFRAKV